MGAVEEEVEVWVERLLAVGTMDGAEAAIVSETWSVDADVAAINGVVVVAVDDAAKEPF